VTKSSTKPQSKKIVFVWLDTKKWSANLGYLVLKNWATLVVILIILLVCNDLVSVAECEGLAKNAAEKITDESLSGEGWWQTGVGVALWRTGALIAFLSPQTLSVGLAIGSTMGAGGVMMWSGLWEWHKSRDRRIDVQYERQAHQAQIEELQKQIQQLSAENKALKEAAVQHKEFEWHMLWEKVLAFLKNLGPTWYEMFMQHWILYLTMMSITLVALLILPRLAVFMRVFTELRDKGMSKEEAGDAAWKASNEIANVPSSSTNPKDNTTSDSKIADTNSVQDSVAKTTKHDAAS